MNPASLPEHVVNKLSDLLGVAQLLGLAAVVVIGGAALTSTLLLLRVGLPRVVARLDAAAVSRSGWRRFAIGLFNVPPLLVLAIALGSQGGTRALGILVLAILIALAVLGLTVEASILGQRLLALAGRETREPAATLTGGALLTGVFLLPFLGWAAFAAILIRATGTAVSGLLARRRASSI